MKDREAYSSGTTLSITLQTDTLEVAKLDSASQTQIP